MMLIYHIVKRSDWEISQRRGVYRTPSLEKDGFIHCSLAHQIPSVANYNFKGQSELVLLEIDVGKLIPQVRLEDLYGEGKEYPHIYGELNLDAVLRVVDFPCEVDGTFKLPTSISTEQARKSGAQILLLSTFHFANPSLDVVKHSVCDVLSKESQSYIEELSTKVSQFRPTHVLLEYDIVEDVDVNAKYAKYLNSEFSLEKSEVDQLGFRIAKLSGLSRVESFDDRKTPWLAKNLFDDLKNEPQVEQRFNNAVKEFTDIEVQMHSTDSLRDILRQYNNPQYENLNKSLYLITNVVGVNNSFSGADASASWWHRNFRMLARIQKFASTGQRVLVIGGQGHIAVIKDLLRYDLSVNVMDVHRYL